MEFFRGSFNIEAASIPADGFLTLPQLGFQQSTMASIHPILWIVLGLSLAGCPSEEGKPQMGFSQDWDHCESIPAAWRACPPSEICDLVNCGDPTSSFDKHGCPRKLCSQHSDCAVGQRCFITALDTGRLCVSSTFEGCHKKAPHEGCFCSASDDCGYKIHCVESDEVPQNRDCALTGLNDNELAQMRNLLEAALEDTLTAGVNAELKACLQRVLGQLNTL